MSFVVVSLVAAAAAASLLATAFAFAAQRGDPAGRGLGQAYLVVALGVAWLLVAGAVAAAVLGPTGSDNPAAEAGRGLDLATFGALVVGFTSPLASLPYLAKAQPRGRWPAVVCGNLFAVPAALLMHAAWRAAVLPLPSAWAVHGCFALVVIGASVPWLARALTRRQTTSPAPVYPALLVRSQERAIVLRAAGELAGLPGAWFAGDARLIDASGLPWTLRGSPAATSLTQTGDRMRFPEVCELLLGLPHLHDDAAEEARLRRLIPQQRDVTALSFLLPR